jgi:hypothetical protein
MSDLSAGLFLRHYSRLARGAILAGLCLAAAGCSAASSPSSATSSQEPSPASYDGAPLTLNNAPGLSSAFWSPTAPRSTAAPRDPVAAGPPADPFAGTPADDWADGANGIVLPAAKPIGGFTRDQVKFAYQRTRKLLVAANLDPTTLLGGAPTAFAEPPHTPASWMRIVNEVGWTLSFGDWAGAATTFEPSISTTGIGGVAGAVCGTSDGYQHPDYPDNPSAEARPSDSPTGTPVDPYVMGQSRPGGCQAVTST